MGNDEKQEYQGPITRSRARAHNKVNLSTEEISERDEEIPREGLPILVHIEGFGGGPVLTDLLQMEIIGENCEWLYSGIPHECRHIEWVLSVSLLCPKKWLPVLWPKISRTWVIAGAFELIFNAQLCSRSKINLIVQDQEKNWAEAEHKVLAPQQVSSQPQIEETMNRMMTGILTKVDEKLKSYLVTIVYHEFLAKLLQLTKLYLLQRLHQCQKVKILLRGGGSLSLYNSMSLNF